CYRDWSSDVCSSDLNGNQFYYVIKQGVWVAVGFIVMLLAMQFNYQQLKSRRIVYGLLLLTTIMLLAVFGFGRINGAHRWIKFRRSEERRVGKECSSG